MNPWSLLNCLKYANILYYRWILGQKQDVRYKARLVARGFEQRRSSVHASVKLVLSQAASDKLNSMTFDIKTAFLHENLEEEIFMYQPKGFDDGIDPACKMNKAFTD